MMKSHLMTSLLAAGLLLSACSPEPQNTGPEAIAPLVDIQTHDSKRDRDLAIRWWAPANIGGQRKYPLVIYAHGLAVISKTAVGRGSISPATALLWLLLVSPKPMGVILKIWT